MQEQVNLKELEKRAFISYHQDGLWDMYLGFLMLVTPLAGVIKDLGFSENIGLGVHLGSIMFALGVFIFLKKKVTVPRLGHAEFGPERKIKKKKLRIVLSVSAAIGVALYGAAVAASKGNDGLLVALVTDQNALGLFAFANFVIVFSLIGYYLDFSRAYVMGILFGAGFAAAIMTDMAIYIMLAGLMFSLLGIVYFVRFLRNNPRPEMEHAIH